MLENYFEKGEKYRETYEAHGRNLLAINNAIENYKKALKLDPKNVLYHYRLGYTYHLMRRLMEASSEYEIVLRLDPPQMATEEDLKIVGKYTPRLFTNPKEFFKLKDLVVVIHPEKPVIAYNIFWEDDIDYPGDNDPSDHEVVWIEFNKSKGKVTGVYTYFHKAILSTEEAVKDANLRNQRARINVEWGGHGSLPLRWEKLHPEVTFKKISKRIKIKDMAQRYQELSKSIKNPHHPLAKDWPKKFTGNYKDFITFTKYIEIRRFLTKKKMVIISKWPNAVINRYFLNYNYFPKKQWPKE
jgi:tetratricopeptide (TPR) repeat protein